VKRFGRVAMGALATFLATLLVTAVGAAPAHAEVTYWYHPGDAMVNPNRGLCTGGWALRLNGEARFATAGHCFPGGYVISRRDNRGFAVATENAYDSAALDAELVDPYPDTDAYQIVYGYQVVGKYDNGSFGYGFHVLKYGQTTGLTELSVVGWSTWLFGTPVVCATGGWAHGDSGGPVFTHDSAGRAWAAGLFVGGKPDGHGGEYACFLTIDQVLAQFGATLPVFPTWSAAPALAGPGPRTAFPASLPKLTGPATFIPA
jgi:hypothetical protein